jgi:hypothetical protein
MHPHWVKQTSTGAEYPSILIGMNILTKNSLQCFLVRYLNIMESRADSLERVQIGEKESIEREMGLKHFL